MFLEKDTNDDLYYLEICRRFIDHIDEMLRIDVEDNKSIGKWGADEILSKVPEGSFIRILTHCNTGSLATAGYGTALGVIRSLHERGKLGKFRF